MGAAESVPEEPAWKRVPGDKLNKLNLPAVHEFYLPPPVQGGKATKRSICRCWLSKRFPICDNSHLKLHKQGLEIGPTLLEFRAAGTGTGNLGPLTQSRVKAMVGTPVPVLKQAGPAAFGIVVAVVASQAFGIHVSWN
jgi:CDGSH-type Zn-finger protein